MLKSASDQLDRWIAGRKKSANDIAKQRDKIKKEQDKLDALQERFDNLPKGDTPMPIPVKFFVTPGSSAIQWIEAHGYEYTLLQPEGN